jgi:hypothetical protein
MRRHWATQPTGAIGMDSNPRRRAHSDLRAVLAVLPDNYENKFILLYFNLQIGYMPWPYSYHGYSLAPFFSVN